MNSPSTQAWTVTLGERIRRGRLARLWSLEDLAVRVGVSRQAIHTWEVGKASPRLRNIRKVWEVFSSHPLYPEGMPQDHEKPLRTTTEIDDRVFFEDLLSDSVPEY